MSKETDVKTLVHKEIGLLRVNLTCHCATDVVNRRVGKIEYIGEFLK